MKNLFFALALFSASASAQVVMTLPNDGGGNIELTDLMVSAEGVREFPECNGRHYAKSWSPKARDIYGCWTYNASAGTILIYWPVADEHRTYSLREFSPTDHFYKKYGKK